MFPGDCKVIKFSNYTFVVNFMLHSYHVLEMLKKIIISLMLQKLKHHTNNFYLKVQTVIHKIV